MKEREKVHPTRWVDGSARNTRQTSQWMQKWDRMVTNKVGAQEREKRDPPSEGVRGDKQVRGRMKKKKMVQWKGENNLLLNKK